LPPAGYLLCRRPPAQRQSCCRSFAAGKPCGQGRAAIQDAPAKTCHRRAGAERMPALQRFCANAKLARSLILGKVLGEKWFGCHGRISNVW
jgi:hypothetical protein